MKIIYNNTKLLLNGQKVYQKPNEFLDQLYDQFSQCFVLVREKLITVDKMNDCDRELLHKMVTQEMDNLSD